MLRLLIVLAMSSLVSAADPPLDRKTLKPGLVAGFVEYEERPQTTTLSRLEPTVALLLAPGESMHPGQSRTSTAEWRGYIQIVTPGEYTFSANVQAMHVNVSLRKDGKIQEVMNADGPLENAGLLTGKPLNLEAGFYAFCAISNAPSERKDAMRSFAVERRFELLWQGPGFRREPIPYFFFSHHPSQRGERFEGDQVINHGRLLFEELACIQCHQTVKKESRFVERTGPELTKIGSRAYAGWIDAWLADPAKLRPHTAMPKLFDESDRGTAERYAVTQYLVSHGGPLPEFKPPKIDSNYSRSLSNGSALFTTIGCAACHGPKLAGTMKRNDDDDDPPPFEPFGAIHGFGTATGAQAIYSLGGVGSKTTPDELAYFLRNPQKTNPHGRMPAMGLSNDDARDIARHLMRFTEETIPDKTRVKEPKWKATQLAEGILSEDEQRTLANENPAQQWRNLGARLFVTKGCANCHTMEDDGKPVTKRSDFSSLEAMAKSRHDTCKSAVYQLSREQQKAVSAFAKRAALPQHPSPAYDARVALKRFNCLNCHMKDGEGGLGNELADAMKKLANQANEDDVTPPRLTGIGHKATSAWLHGVLIKGDRTRPWMSLRMPQYGEANVSHLVAGLPMCEGLPPQPALEKTKVTASLIEQGRKLVGKEGLGCAACHDISGYAGSGTRGPDLALTDKHVNREWFTRWMHNPQRLAPGTKMPSNFTDGRSVSDLLNANADAQIEAIWAYLSLGPGLPLPTGLEPPGKGLPMIVKDRPEIIRTFMPDNAGTRPIAVGFPNGAGSYVFDSHACRISYAWEGNFLDVAPVWTQRGGNAARLLGPKFLVPPAGHPWLVNDGDKPDFEARADDPAYGKPLLFGEIFKKPMRVQFQSYTLDTQGVPTFRYAVDGLNVIDTPQPRKGTIASGLQRNFVVDRPAGKTVWYLAGTSTKPPRMVNGVIVLPQPNDRALVISIAALPKDAEWVKSETSVMLKLPPLQSKDVAEIAWIVWSLPRDDDSLLPALGAK